MSEATLLPVGRLAAAAIAALLLAGCAGGQTTTPPAPPACPGALILQGAERTTAYAEGAPASPSAQRYLAVVTNLASACSYVEAGVDVDLAFDLIVERGPALEGDSVGLTYFVATMGPDEEILAKQLLTSEIAFEPAERVAGSAEQLTLRLPGVAPEDGAAYALYLGFQLDDAELDQRLQPLLR